MIDAGGREREREKECLTLSPLLKQAEREEREEKRREEQKVKNSGGGGRRRTRRTRSPLPCCGPDHHPPINRFVQKKRGQSWCGGDSEGGGR